MKSRGVAAPLGAGRTARRAHRLAFLIFFLAGISGLLRAADLPAPPQPGPVSKPPADQPAAPVERVEMRPMLITGSLIPQRVRVSLRETALQRNVIIIDEEQIRRSGASSLAAVLRRTVPSVR